MPMVRVNAPRSVTWWIGLALVPVSGAAFLVARSYGVAGLMPGLSSAAIFLLAVLHTVSGLAAGLVVNTEGWHDENERAAYARRRLAYVVIAVGVVAAIWLVGFHITLPAFLLLFVGLATRQWITAAFLAFGIWVFTYVVLFKTLHLVFPSSVLRNWMIANGYY